MLKHTPYFHRFQALGATFKDRCGFATVDFFSSVAAEHRATRESVGMFDVFNEVCVEVKGRDAERLLARLMTADVRRMPKGGVLYSLLCNEQGGIVDELLCFKFDSDRFWLTPTPSQVDAVAAYVEGHARALSVAVTNLGYANAYLSVQGPASRQLLSGLTDENLSNEALPFCRFTQGRLANVPKAMIARSGYSGELGYELFFPVEYAEHVWDAVAQAGVSFGVLPCGMKTMRSLRIEKRFVLYGLDISTNHDPISAGLQHAVRFDDRDFIGHRVLRSLADGGTPTRLCLLNLGGEHPAATGDVVLSGGETVGRVTSADYGHTVGATLCLAYLPRALAVEGTEVRVAVKAAGGQMVSSRVLIRAPYDPDASRVRS